MAHQPKVCKHNILPTRKTLVCTLCTDESFWIYSTQFMKSDLLLVREFLVRLWAEFQPRPTPQPPVQIDFRDRISVITWLVVFGLGLSLLYSIPTTIVSFRALGSPVTIEFTTTMVAAMFMATLVATGTESVIRVHPRFAVVTHRSVWRTWPFWTLPMAIVIIAVYVLPLTPTGLVRVLALLLSGALLGFAYFSLYVTVERGQAGFRRARFVLDALSYGSALILFLFVYQTRTRQLAFWHVGSDDGDLAGCRDSAQHDGSTADDDHLRRDRRLGLGSGDVGT